MWNAVLTGERIFRNATATCDEVRSSSASSTILGCWGFDADSNDVGEFVRGDQHTDWCTDVSDAGLVLESTCESCFATVVRGASWGFCNKEQERYASVPLTHACVDRALMPHHRGGMMRIRQEGYREVHVHDPSDSCVC